MAALRDEDAAVLRSASQGAVALPGLRKIIADAMAAPVFRLCCLIDGVADPDDAEGAWPTFHLAEADENAHEHLMLHDAFFDSYWLWRDRRPDPGWKLDTFEDTGDSRE